tara:strand:+ start:1174 stop:1803 length:630 start_codon:yes stop_codon:yes gene_type:complete
LKFYYLILIITFSLLVSENYYEYWPNDSLKIKGKIINGLKSGKWEYFNLKGKVWKYEIYETGKIVDEMYWQIFKPTKNEIESLENQFNNNIIIIKDSINNNKDSIINKNSILYGYTGDWIEYYENGTLKSVIEYMNGLKHGKSNYYDKEEKLIRTERFLSGKKHGKWIWYWENKKIKEVGYFNLDEKFGKWIKFDKLGNEILVKNYNKI